MIVKGRVVGGERVTLDLRKGGFTVMESVRKSVRKLGMDLERIVKVDTLAGQVLHRRTGAGARSINTRFTSTPTSETAAVGTRKDYMVAWQTGFHLPERVIEAKNGKALFWPGAAHPVRSVRQPARDVAARPYLTIALNIIRPRVAPTLADAVMAGIDKGRRGAYDPSKDFGLG